MDATVPADEECDHRVGIGMVARFVRPVHSPVCGAGRRRAVLSFECPYVIARRGLRVVCRDVVDAPGRFRHLWSLWGSDRP